jgi:methylase of polypeptide subunit release factors
MGGRKTDFMKNTIRKLVKTIAKRLRIGKLFWFLYGLLQEPDKADLFSDTKADSVFRYFADSYGNRLELVAGLRDRLKPGWQAMLLPAQAPVPKSPSVCLANIKAWRESLDRVGSFLGTFSLSFVGKEVIEIGTDDGVTAYSLAAAGAKNVLATDTAAYSIMQSIGGVVCEDAIAAK